MRNLTALTTRPKSNAAKTEDYTAMKTRYFALIALVLLSSLPLSAQDAGSDDVGLSVEISAEKKLSKRFTADLDAEYRMRNDIGSFDRFTVGPGVEYKITGWLKASAGAVYMLVNNDSKEKYRDDASLKWRRESVNSSRYRVYASLTGSVKYKRFKFSLRERYQFTFRPEYTATRDYYIKSGEYNYSEEDVRASKSYNVLRSRLTASYNIRHCPLAPFAYAELYNDLGGRFGTKKIRYSVGTNWRVNKNHSLSISWLYQDVRGDDGDNDANTHLIGVGYTYSF